MSAGYDWTGNPDARHNRDRKARAAVEWCQAHDVDPRVMAGQRDRNRIMREAGGYIEVGGKRRARWPKASEETWREVTDLYSRWFDATWLARELAGPPRRA